MTKTIKLDQVRIDGGTQSRAALNDEAVADYAATIREGTDFPPIVVFHDGKHHWLADGFHRYHAYRQAGAVEIAVDVREGTKRDAKLFSAGANGDHGLRRTNADKRSAVAILLDDAEWSTWSNSEIARRAVVGEALVRSLRSERSEETPAERSYTTKHGTKARMKTGKIGKSKEEKAADKAARDAQQAINDQQQAATIDALPEAIQNIERAKHRNGARNAAVPRAPVEDIEKIKAERDELREENAALKADIAERDRRLAMFEDTAVLFAKGGVEAIIAAKDETIRAQATRIERESGDKVEWKKSADYWKKEALKLGWSKDVVIPV